MVLGSRSKPFIEHHLTGNSGISNHALNLIRIYACPRLSNKIMKEAKKSLMSEITLESLFFSNIFVDIVIFSFPLECVRFFGLSHHSQDIHLKF